MKVIFMGLMICVYVTSFSLGDELGFAESLGNLEGGRRRAINYRNGPNNIGVLPGAKQSQFIAPPVHQSLPVAITSRPKSRPQRIATRPPQSMVQHQKSIGSNLMTEAASLPLGVPAFKPIPPKDTQLSHNTLTKKVMVPYQYQSEAPKSPYPVPAFQSLPNSISRISTGEILQVDNNNPAYDQDQSLPAVNLMGHTVEELAAAANVSVETIKEAIFLRQQQLMTEQQNSVFRQQIMSNSFATTSKPIASKTTTQRITTTTTTVLPTKKVVMRPAIPGGNKVMNAPKEYYPVGYEKNFDDNFTTKVDLPSTSFHCGDQKHFPGLYADMDLGCMVFHVCALTDDGLIMKSFLCPESTLFDQTVLKCNWWFYVDCKSSKTLYDSNLPVSKSYQLMKSLTYFSNYKSSNNDKDGIDIEALKNTVADSSDDRTEKSE